MRLFHSLLKIVPLLCASLSLVAKAAPMTGDGARKMCWCHVVRWGFFQKTYDTAGAVQDAENVATDRTLLGELTQERASFWGNTKVCIRTAMQYGIDGFCVDMVDPKSYIDMGAFLHAAEGTDFKVALAMDNYTHRNADYCIEHIGNYLRKYYNHPNHARIDGKPVIFIYSAGIPLAEWKKVVDALREQGLEAFYINRTGFEWTMCDNIDDVKASMEVNDGVYDFGCCGFTPAQMVQRLRNMSSGIEQSCNPDGMLVAGVAPGYLGRAVGNYRPFMNSLSTMWNWEAIMANPRVNWVCITTWNDYTETTHIEPSVVNRDALARLDQEYTRIWKGLPLPTRPAQPIVSYHEEVTFGHDLTLEILNFPYTSGDFAVSLKLVDASNNNVIREFKNVRLPKDKLHATTLRLKHSDLGDAQFIRLFAKMSNTADDKCGFFTGRNKEMELYPITRRVEHVESQRIIRLPLTDMIDMKMDLVHENGKLIAKLRAYEVGGKLELLRNGYPVEERVFQHSGKPLCQFEFDVPKFGRSSQDVYVLRYTNVSNELCFSYPLALRYGDAQKTVQQPVVITGSDFDEDWPLWKRPAARMGTMTVTEDSIYKLCFDFSEGEGKVARSSTAWKLPLSLGVPGMGFNSLRDGHLTPEWIETEGPDGTARKVLKFYGDSIATLPVRSMPIGVFTMEALINPEQFEKPVTLFGEQKPFAFYIQPDGRLALEYLLPYGNKRIVSRKPVPFGKWSHVAIVCAGNKAQIFLNGRVVGEGPLVPQTMPINSLPALGNAARSRVEGFRGLMAGYAMAGTVLSPDSFQLPIPKAE